MPTPRRKHIGRLKKQGKYITIKNQMQLFETIYRNKKLELLVKPIINRTKKSY